MTGNTNQSLPATVRLAMSLFHPLLFFYCDSDVCVDTAPEGAVDNYGYGCDNCIGLESDFGCYDDSLVTEEMCCACGGGTGGVAPGNACKYTYTRFSV